MLAHFRPAFSMLIVWSVLTGLVYPGLVTGIGQALFPGKANGSLIRDGQGQAVGSQLIGQAFDDPRYFWGRPSATAPYAYNAAASGGSNLGPSNAALADAVKARVEALRGADSGIVALVPVDLVTASASGLDPHISPAAAIFQIARVAKTRHLPQERLDELVRAHTESRLWSIIGEPRVNVLLLNRALDAME